MANLFVLVYPIRKIHLHQIYKKMFYLSPPNTPTTQVCGELNFAGYNVAEVGGANKSFAEIGLSKPRGFVESF